MNRWGPDGPPPEAYSRVGDPERFRPLHAAALRLLEQLEAAFNVARFEGYDLDSELKAGGFARPIVRLVPRDPKGAPLTVAFTTFPGLNLRIGRWTLIALPACGCDACDETPDSEATRLTELVDDVTSGRFQEKILLPPDEDGWVESEFWSWHQRHSTRSQIDSAGVRERPAGSEPSVIEWGPWPRR